MTDLSKTLLVVDNEVWVSDPKDSWVLGKVTKLDADGKSATVKVAGESDERSLAISDCHRVNDTHNGGGEEVRLRARFVKPMFRSKANQRGCGERRPVSCLMSCDSWLGE